MFLIGQKAYQAIRCEKLRRSFPLRVVSYFKATLLLSMPSGACQLEGREQQQQQQGQARLGRESVEGEEGWQPERGSNTSRRQNS